jgi:hypothetical protein
MLSREDGMDAPKPLGYWLQHLHNLLEEQFAVVLSDLGVDRRQWQLLNTLSRGHRTRGDLADALAPFWTGGEPSPLGVLADLTARGWVAESDGMVALTQQGVAAHAELAQRVDQTRRVVADGLTAEQYHETVRILTVMASNLEADLASRRG